MKNRFTYIEKGLDMGSKALEKIGYKQLPDCGSFLNKIVIDGLKKQFWLVNDYGFKLNEETIKSHHLQDINRVTIQDIA